MFNTPTMYHFSFVLFLVWFVLPFPPSPIPFFVYSSTHSRPLLLMFSSYISLFSFVSVLLFPTACTVILDALRALLNGPLFQPPPPLLPPAAKGGAAYDKSASNKPWRMTSTTSPDASTSPAAAFSSSNLISHYSADLALALNPPTSATTSRRGSPSLTSPSPSSSPPLPSACVVPFQRDIVRRALAQTAAEARAKARIRSGALHLQGGNNYDIGLPKPLMKPDSHASTGEGRLRQVLMREVKKDSVELDEFVVCYESKGVFFLRLRVYASHSFSLQ